MENKVALSASVPPVEPARPAARQTPPAQEAPEPRQELADLRLVIEENGNTGTFVYKTIDRRTGEVVSQIPREDVLKLHDSQGYESGSVIKTQA